jgi:hypothetical protein
MSKRKAADRGGLDRAMRLSQLRSLKDFGTPAWHARDIKKHGFYGDVGEIENLIYHIGHYAEYAGPKFSERDWASSGLAFLHDRLQVACALQDDTSTGAESCAFHAMQQACARAFAVVRSRKAPEDWETATVQQLRSLLLEIHACEGDLLRFERILGRAGNSDGGLQKTAKATKLLKAMQAALRGKLRRRVTAKKLVAEAKARGWIEERGGDLLLKYRGAQSIIANDLKLIGDRLRNSSQN